MLLPSSGMPQLPGAQLHHVSCCPCAGWDVERDRRLQHQHLPSCQNTETGLGILLQAAEHLRGAEHGTVVLLGDAHPMPLGTTQVCQAERAPHGWHKCPWRGRGQQKCPSAWRRDTRVTVRLPLTSPA